jgi:hypothetical protein|tara:strand:+ start:472 stop:903 length:432 start_codon:yes stop_codon:yes gene_type:complete
MTTNEELLKRIEQLETINKVHEKKRDLEQQAVRMALTQVNYLNKWTKEIDGRLDWLTHSHDHWAMLWAQMAERYQHSYEQAVQWGIENLAKPAEELQIDSEVQNNADELFPGYRPIRNRRGSSSSETIPARQDRLPSSEQHTT